MTNRIAKYLDPGANVGTPRHSVGRGKQMPNGQTKAVAARSAFGERFATIMAAAGIGTPTLISEALDEKWTKRQVSYLYAADYKTPADAKETTPLLKACADLAGVPVERFFSDAPVAPKKEGPPDELIGMVAKALDGPKADFLADAIEMAYAAAVTSKSNYRHR
jgi:hypothetical protein